MTTELVKGQSWSYVNPHITSVQQEQLDLGDLDGDGKSEYAQLGVKQVSIDCSQTKSPVTAVSTYTNPGALVSFISDYVNGLDTYCDNNPYTIETFSCNPRIFWAQNCSLDNTSYHACLSGASAVGQIFSAPWLNPDIQKNLPNELYSSLLPIAWSAKTNPTGKTVTLQEPGSRGKQITGKLVDIRATRIFPVKRMRTLFEFMLNAVTAKEAGTSSLAALKFLFSNDEADRQTAINELRKVLTNHMGEPIMEFYENVECDASGESCVGNVGTWPREPINELDLKLFDEYVPTLMDILKDNLGTYNIAGCRIFNGEIEAEYLLSLSQEPLTGSFGTNDMTLIYNTIWNAYVNLKEQDSGFYENLDRNYNFTELYAVIVDTSSNTHLVRINKNQLSELLDK